MDDLAGLNWSAPNPNSAKPAPSPTPAYPSLRPTPSPFASGRNTPLSAQGSGTPGTRPPPTSKPAQDSFNNLLNFGPGKGSANLSLRERQDQLEAEKRRKEEERRKQAQAHYGDGSFLDSLGRNQSGSLRTPSPGAALAPPPAAGPSAGLRNGKTAAESDDDLFSAFNASTKVDNSSHYPPPAPSSNPSPANAPGLDLKNSQSWNTSAPYGGGDFGDGNDDDPFGLNQLKPKTSARPSTAAAAAAGSDEDDDLLGDLGKPVDQVRKKVAPSFARGPEPGKPIEDSSSDSEVEQPVASDDPFDKAVAQLVDYGFTPENARRGLTESGGGLDVQAAVNWLLDDAHRQAKEKAKGGARSGEERAPSQSRDGTPSWMHDGPQGGDGARSRDNRSPASMEGDFAKTAAAVGTSFLKTANNLWKSGQKKVQKAVAEFQQDGDPNQPKWMRSAGQDRSAGAAGRRAADVTDEALMLESGGRQPARPTRPAPERHPSSETLSRDRSPALPTRPRQEGQVPKWQQSSQPHLDTRSRLSRQVAEEESFQAYVSPARRKKTTPQPTPEVRPPAEPEPDLLFGGSAPPTSRPTPPLRSSQPSPAARPAARPSPARSPAPAPRLRQIPPISPAALQTSTKHRLEGTSHFKRGDFAAAHASYTSSLTAIPPDHPLAIVLLCNRALTALKTGEPRQAVEDADTAVRLIGPGKGEGEHVEIAGDTPGSGDEKRDMRDLYGKALTRKAEALEQMEKWADAAAVWQLCVEAGRGGATAAAGRLRCQKALAPKPTASSTLTPRPSVAAAAAASSSRQPTPASAAGRPRPAAQTQKSSEAVARLRAAHQAAEREGDEKIALTDQVDARIAAWRDGKRDNLRALLGSLDAVLWEGSGWKKVGLHELVVAGKVKVVYMRAIAKTHPDKIAQDATTEVRMIAGTVFSTLNEAWDKFKAENNM